MTFGDKLAVLALCVLFIGAVGTIICHITNIKLIRVFFVIAFVIAPIVLMAAFLYPLFSYYMPLS